MLTKIAVQSWQNRTVRSAFATWFEYTADAVREKDVVSRAAAYYSKRGAIYALDKWFEYAREKSTARRLLRKALSFWRKGKLRKYATLWELFTFQAQIERKARMHYDQSFKRAGIRKWISFTIKQARMKVLLKRATKHWTSAIEARLFDRWADAAADRKENRQNIGKAAAFWRGNLEARYLETWKLKTRSNLRLRLLIRTFRKYKSIYVNNKTIAQRMAATARRWRSFKQHRAIQKWVAYTRQRYRYKQTVRHAVRHFRQGVSARSFITWVERVRERKRAREALADAISLWNRNCKTDYFKAWVKFRKAQTLLHNAVAKMRRFRASRAVDRWVSFTESRFVAKSRLRAALRLLSSNRLGSTFAKWCRFLAVAKEEHAKWDLACEHHERVLQTCYLSRLFLFAQDRRRYHARMREAGRHFLHAKKLSAIKALQSHAERAREVRQDTAVARSHFRRSCLRKNVSAWISATAAVLHEKAKLAYAAKYWRNHQIRVMLVHWARTTAHGRAIRLVHMRWKHRDKLKAFNGLKENAAERRVNREAAERAMLYWTQRRQLVAVRHWQSWSEERVHIRQLSSFLRQVIKYIMLKKWENRTAEAAFLRDEEESADNFRRRSLLKRHLSLWLVFVDDILDDRTKLDRARKRLENGVLFRAYARWQQYAVERSDARARAAKAVSQWENFKLAAAIRSWFTWSRDRVLRRNYARRAFGKYSQVSRSNHLLAWRSLSRAYRMNRCARKRKYLRAWASTAHDAANLKRAATHLFGSTLHRFFDKWKVDFIRARRDLRRKLFRLGELWGRARRAAALATLRARFREQQSLEASLHLWHETVLARYFRLWHEHARWYRAYATIQMRSGRRRKVSIAQRLFMSWTLSTARASALRAVVHRQLRKLAYLSFVRWIEVAVRRRRAEELRDRALRGMLNACALGAMRRWKTAVHAMKVERATLKAGAVCWARREGTRALQTWLAWAVRHRIRKSKLKIADQHSSRGYLVRGFRGWVSSMSWEEGAGREDGREEGRDRDS